MAQDTPLRRVVLAHELGHHHLTTGVHLQLYQCRPSLATSQVEVRAERWAGERLLPRSLIRAIAVGGGCLGPEEAAELAELARVPLPFVTWWLRDLSQRGLMPPRRCR
ncbi:MAG TPA: ImmA/IrrE family metallo-endopeptidase [Chloroflexota bacterium]|nr:ImmA/IrrE family metallo-endopeptidase [Chloroflexota bacterium]